MEGYLARLDELEGVEEELDEVRHHATALQAEMESQIEGLEGELATLRAESKGLREDLERESALHRAAKTANKELEEGFAAERELLQGRLREEQGMLGVREEMNQEFRLQATQA